ncbi:ammonium transporter [Ideonella sp. TBM-1]|uniref:Ammonium transporter n=2 Tax=Ideonella livida TaxID=2707176 RepID=A0A7C9THJ1_9BURK|nr:ammonium transporter [Ideonella livida]
MLVSAPLPALSQAASEPAAPASTAASTAVVAPEAQVSPPASPAASAAPLNAPATAPSPFPSNVPVAQLSAGDTAWMIAASALVLLMTLPGLALFYAGMVRKKNILGTMAQVIAICSLVSVLWLVCGYSLAFMPGNAWIGSLHAAWLDTVRFDKAAGLVSVHPLAATIPESVFVMFQLTFAIITPALIVGAFAERFRFSALFWFITLWVVLVYAPVAHWVWSPEGWLASMGALDFAGGTVVHINAGIAGLVAAWMVGPRQGFGRVALMPANLGYTLIGAALLWVGWIGFNGGSAAAADGRAGMAMLVTHIAAAAAALSWMLVEWLVRRTPTLLGLCSGAVAGLVAITPASGFVGPKAALLIGLVAGAGCYWGATGLKRRLGKDDSLDVFGVHGVGGLIGALLTGLLADPKIGGVEGSVLTQAIAAGATLVYSGLMTALILWVVKMLIGLRVTERQEQDGLDLSQHGERVE